MNSASDKKPDKKTEKSYVLTALFEHWSSHPSSLKKQRTWLFVLGLIPIIAVGIFIAFLLTGISGWRSIIEHPKFYFWIIGVAISLSFGFVFSFALLYLLARSRLAATTEDPDRLPFSKWMVILFSFFWVIPAALSFCQSRGWCILVPQQLLFLLNALCFAPFVLLLIWVQFAEGESVGEEGKKIRRPLWFVLGTFLLGLALLSLFGDLQIYASKLHFPQKISGLSTLTLRMAVLAALLPISMICYSVWLLFRRTMTKEEVEQIKIENTSEQKEKRSFWRRVLDFFKGVTANKEAEDPETEDGPPAWLSQFCNRLPDGVRINSKEPPKPNRLPSDDIPTSPLDCSDDAYPFWVLMGGEEDRHPTNLQVQFFKRFCDSVDESWNAAVKGNELLSDIILAGDEGSGRTEALLATALYSAFARRQRVLYLVSDPNQAKTLCEKANNRFKDIFLNCFLSAEILDGKKAAKWVNELKTLDEKDSKEKEGEKDGIIPSGQDGAAPEHSVPPNILFATPRDVEHIFFEGHGVDSDGSSIPYLRDLLRLFEVILVDDFMEFDVTERAHLPFILHKLRLILVSGNLRPQFVVVTPRLRDDKAVNIIAERLFGSNFNLANNIITLLPRKCSPAWSLPLVLKDGLNVGLICEKLVKECLELSTDAGEKLKIVLYRKGLHPHQCEELAAKLAPPESRDDLQVVSRIDEINIKNGADAVFYLTSLAGCADMTLRLSVGDGKTVYLSLSSESETVLKDDGGRCILPAIPDSTAVALRVHHLVSMLRFVVPGQPLDVSAWERFGVFISNSIRTVDIPEGAIIHEKWRQDEWTEKEYGEPPLWPYVVFEADGSVRSNAGKGTDFGVLPFTDEDIAKLGDEPLMGFVKPKVKNESGEQNAGIGNGSFAKWKDKQDITRGVIDLAHAETLVFGRSSLGDVYSSVSDAVDTVFTVKSFEEPNPGDNSCVCKLKMTPWNGDGMDFDTPIRSLSWTVEPASEPKTVENDPAKAFSLFDLPDCRNVPRVISGVIVGRINRIGQSITEASDESVRKYNYPAYLSGILIAPRKLSSKDGLAQIQRGVIGSWSTDDQSFSVVLTHLLTGVLIRIIPDLPFYACVPVFHQRGKRSAVAAAVAWIVQPLNSGKTVEDLLSFLLLKADGQASFQKALSEARKIFESRPDPESKLRWLRLFSRSAFAFDLEEPGMKERFEKDVEWSLEVLSILDERISGNLAQIEEFSSPVPEISIDFNWISEPKRLDSSSFYSEAVWKARADFPAPPKLDCKGVTCRWHYLGKEFTISMGFEETDGKERYNGFLDNSFNKRICGDSYTEYGFNDPYREFIGELSRKLRQIINEKIPKATPDQIAEFLLSFVQEGLPYVLDPTDKQSDWPRHPSETIMHEGGDCEDSSILYAELLRQFNIEGAILSMPKHAAVGVNVEMSLTSDRKEPIIYSWLGKKYVYAETANNGFVTPLGSETELAVPADIIPTPNIPEDSSTPVRIINAVGPNSGSLEITLVAPEGTTKPLVVAVFARPKRGVFEAPDKPSYICVGGAKLPALEARKVYTATLALQTPDLRNYWYDIFVCEGDTGVVRGHFVGVARFKS
ncbi:hypothetical protein J6U78_07530 [bacterium]|nr:hypothetical protein [bacterium]